MPRTTHRILATTVAAFIASFISACSDRSTAPPPLRPEARASDVTPADVITPQLVRQLAAGRGIVPLPPPPRVRPALAKLGQALVDRRKAVERLVQRENLVELDFESRVAVAQRNPRRPATVLLGPPPPSEVDENLPHSA